MYVYESFAQPEEGVYWITLTANHDIEELEVYVYWEEAPEPPELDEMTELNNGIAVTNQRISRNSGDFVFLCGFGRTPCGIEEVKTFGGRGDCELHIAYEALPYTDDWGWIEDDFFFEESKSSSGRQFDGQETSDHSYNPEMRKRFNCLMHNQEFTMS